MGLKKNFIKNNNGQIAIEFLLIIGFSLILIISLANFLSYENDINVAIAAAREGIEIGVTNSRVAIHESDAYENYVISKNSILHPNSIKIIKIEIVDRGFDSRYNRTSIQLRIFASSPSISSNEDKVSIGSKITYQARKSITETFNTHNLTNNLYNPSFSKEHVFTTSNVQWI